MLTQLNPLPDDAFLCVVDTSVLENFILWHVTPETEVTEEA